jgi:hypothetical protein
LISGKEKNRKIAFDLFQTVAKMEVMINVLTVDENSRDVVTLMS